MNTHSRPPASQQPAHPPASVPNTVSGLRRIKCGPTYAYCARSHSTSFHRPRRRRRGPRTALHPSRVSLVISSSSSPSSSATYLRSAVLVSVVSSSEGTSGSESASAAAVAEQEEGTNLSARVCAFGAALGSNGGSKLGWSASAPSAPEEAHDEAAVAAVDDVALSPTAWPK